MLTGTSGTMLKDVAKLVTDWGVIIDNVTTAVFEW